MVKSVYVELQHAWISHTGKRGLANMDYQRALLFFDGHSPCFWQHLHFPRILSVKEKGL